MIATNHVTTGALFAAVTVSVLPWWVILPVAFLLHFVLDSLPHYGDLKHPDKALHRLRWFLPLDATIALIVLAGIFILRPDSWPIIVAAGVLCASPDLWSVTRYIRFVGSGDTSISKDWFSQFHHNIQWGERPWGIWIEGVWLVVTLSVLWQIIS